MEIEKYPKPATPGAKFSILIPTWNNLPYLQLCLEGLQKNSRYKHEILIHVNEGTDGTLDWVRSSGFFFTYSQENAGVCHALNALASVSSAPYLVYLNDDMFVAPDWDKFLLTEAEKIPTHLFYFSGTMVENERSGNRAAVAPFHFGKGWEDFKRQEFENFAANSTFSDWSGSCWPPSMVHKSIWDAVGGYDPAYSPGFYSDPDFAMKLWQLGVRDFRGIGRSLVYHFRCKSTGRVVPNNGRKTFAQKWGVPSSYFYKKMLRMGEPVKASRQLKEPGKISRKLASFRAWIIAKG